MNWKYLTPKEVCPAGVFLLCIRTCLKKGNSGDEVGFSCTQCHDEKQKKGVISSFLSTLVAITFCKMLSLWWITTTSLLSVGGPSLQGTRRTVLRKRYWTQPWDVAMDHHIHHVEEHDVVMKLVLIFAWETSRCFRPFCKLHKRTSRKDAEICFRMLRESDLKADTHH